MPYHPPAEAIERYADVLVKFALRNGRGIAPGEVVLVSAGEEAKQLYVALRYAVLRCGGTTIGNYAPSGAARETLELASSSSSRPSTAPTTAGSRRRSTTTSPSFRPTIRSSWRASIR